MYLRLYSTALFCFCFATSLPAAATNLVSGNGFGFAVVSPQGGTISKFYAHPYSFLRPDPKNALGEGVETANFLKSLRWDGTGKAAAEYKDDSQIIEIRGDAGRGYVYMPFGLHHAALVVSWLPNSSKQIAGGWRVEWNRPVSARREVQIDGAQVEVLRFDGIEESLVALPLGAKVAGAGSVDDLAGHAGWILLSIENENELDEAVREVNAWRAGLRPEQLVTREVTEVERWRVKPAVTFTGDKERHLWRQSEVMLRMAQSREPDHTGRYGNGLIVASLPDGVWFTPWVRDMAYATVALARMGHRDEARAALLAYFQARPTGKMRNETRGADYQISVVRYFGDGEEEPFFTMEGATNIEFDDWGEVLWALGEYLKRYDDPGLLQTATYRGKLYESARDYVVKPLLANFDSYGSGSIVAEDTSIWEEHQKDQKHFAFSTAAAIVGLKNFAEIARMAGDEAARADVLKHVAQLQTGFDAAFIRGGRLHGTLEEGEKNDIDGALLAIIHLGVVNDPAVIRDTVARMELLKVASGGYRRVRSNYTDPKIFEYWYERQEFLFVDISLAEVYRSLGHRDEAAAMMRRIEDKAAEDHDIIPEMYVALPCDLFPGKIGDPTGARPMAGYGAGAFLLDLLDREKYEAKH
ncbi:glycoside hydrolase family 15 protein [Acidicapsa dinghuensis]|uniref:Glycoside hydrolase family 15 protein n=1 Tax=Acidicapsa dinghuensis TaxID=2218256 RepID=A0ABW1EIA7_9BACT|nr:glycoside hydrolase family 15 protein [Acidicapsa dinghuensis]